MSTTKPDTWSPTFVAVSAIGAALLVLAIEASGAFLLLLALFVILILAIVVAWFLYDLWRWRIRHALSIAAGIGLAVGITYHAPLLGQWKDKAAFRERRAEYEQQVEDARSKQTASKPLQIVVDVEDRTLLAINNSFYYIIYDETDGAGPYENIYWPYNKSSTGVIRVGARSEMRHLTGHFYSFHTSD